MDQKEAFKLCAEYILEIEYGDFVENASKSHVYFAALVALFGYDSACDDLLEAIKTNLENEV